MSDIAGLIKGKDALPIVLHADDGPAVLLRLVVERLSKGADLRIGKSLRRTVGVFALRVVVEQEHHQPSAVARPRVLQHLSVTGRVAKRCTRATADLQVNALRFTGVVVVQKKLWFFGQKRLTVLAIAVLRAAGRAYHLFWRNAIELLRGHAHKILAATRDNVGLVPVGAQVLQDLEHRLIRKLSVETPPAWMLGGFNPFFCFGFEYLHWHTGQWCYENFLKLRQGQLRHRLAVAGKHSLKGLAVLKLWFLCHHRRHTVQAINHLRIHGMFDPQRTVLIESSDALLRRHEFGT